MDLGQALTDIRAMRSQMARDTIFRGYGPATFALTGLLAAAAAWIQSRIIPSPDQNVIAYLALWTGTAAVAATAIGIEVVFRTRRIHHGLADEMIGAAAGQLLPSIGAGTLLTIVLWRFAPESVWMLPGLWQIVLSLGIFASCRALPPALNAVGFWYLATGLACLAFAGGQHALSPWAMGAPFGIGELLAALLIAVTGGRDGEDDVV